MTPPFCEILPAPVNPPVKLSGVVVAEVVIVAPLAKLIPAVELGLTPVKLMVCEPVVAEPVKLTAKKIPVPPVAVLIPVIFKLFAVVIVLPTFEL